MRYSRIGRTFLFGFALIAVFSAIGIFVGIGAEVANTFGDVWAFVFYFGTLLGGAMVLFYVLDR